MFWDEYRINIFDESFSDKLIFTDEFRQNVHIENFSDHLYFQDQLHVGYRVANLTIEQNLEFEDKFSIYHEGDITQFLYFTDSFQYGEQLTQILVFQETWDAEQAIGFKDTLEFTEVWEDFVPIRDGWEDVLEFVDGFQLDDEDKEACIASTIVPRGYIEFVYDSVTIRLRSPEFNDTKSLNSQKAINRLRSGVNNVYKSNIWVDEQTYKFTVAFNKESEFNKFKLFVRESCGKQILWRTHESEEKNVIILNPSAAFSETSRFNHQVSLELVEI